MSPTNGKVLKVAVVIVTYRSAALTLDCLRSLQSERRHPAYQLKVVVVDNASGDYPAIAEGVAREGWGDWVSLVEAPRNGGFAYGNNVGFAHAERLYQPDYFHMLNPDTRVKPGAVGALLAFLEHKPGAGIAGSSFENGDGSDWPIAFRFPGNFVPQQGFNKSGFAQINILKFQISFFWRIHFRQRIQQNASIKFAAISFAAESQIGMLLKKAQGI